jgi:hypothetical protein
MKANATPRRLFLAFAILILFCLAGCVSTLTPAPPTSVVLQPIPLVTTLVTGEKYSFTVTIAPASKLEDYTIKVEGAGLSCEVDPVGAPLTWFCTSLKATDLTNLYAFVYDRNGKEIARSDPYGVTIVDEPTPTTAPPTRTSTPPSATPPPGSVTIIYPQNAQTVPCENLAEGTYDPATVTDPIWPVILIGSRYHPQDDNGGPAAKGDGRWWGTVRFGVCTEPEKDKGKRFQLIVFSAGRECSALFEGYFARGASGGGWPGIPAPLPKDCREQERIYVDRE